MLTQLLVGRYFRFAHGKGRTWTCKAWKIGFVTALWCRMGESKIVSFFTQGWLNSWLCVSYSLILSTWSKSACWCSSASLFIWKWSIVTPGIARSGSFAQGVVIAGTERQVFSLWECLGFSGKDNSRILWQDIYIGCFHYVHAWVVVFCWPPLLITAVPLVLHPKMKMRYFTQYWPEELHNGVQKSAKKIVSNISALQFNILQRNH